MAQFPQYNPFSPPIFAVPQTQSAPNPMLAGRQPSSNYNTPLNPLQEFAYRNWVQQNNVPTDPTSAAPQDYDMRGFYQGLQQGDPRAQSAVDPNDSRMHFPDFWKTPLHQTFSNESQWAPSTAPQWTPNDQLVQPNGRVVFDDKAQNNGGILGFLGLK